MEDNKPNKGDSRIFVTSSGDDCLQIYNGVTWLFRFCPFRASEAECTKDCAHFNDEDESIVELTCGGQPRKIYMFEETKDGGTLHAQV